MTTWIDSTSSAIESLGDGGLSEDGLQDAVDDVRGASETLGDDLQDAGRPETESARRPKPCSTGSQTTWRKACRSSRGRWTTSPREMAP